MTGFRASTVATAANLGPAFDCMAIGLNLRCTVTARKADEWSVEHLTELVPSPGQGDGVLAAAQAVAGDRPLALTVDTEIPMGRGLGSSAAAFSAGAAAALAAIGEEPHPDRVYRIATELEGHDDNVAGAVYGGLVLVPAEGLPMRLPFHPSIRVIVAIPETVQFTPEARAVIDDMHPHARVLRTIARVSALTAGLVTGDPIVLAAAHGDEIHELPRARLGPEVPELMEAARNAGAIHAARSGAGPSVVAFATADSADRVAQAFRTHGARVLADPPASTGLVVG